MGGFFPSEDLEALKIEFGEGVSDRFLDDDLYEALEQCIVMTKVFEDADISKFLEFAEALNPQVKGMPSSLSLMSKIALAKMKDA